MNIFGSCMLFLLPCAFFAQSISVQPDRVISDIRGGIMPCPTFTINSADTSLFGAGEPPQFILPEAKGQHGFVFIGCPHTPPDYALGERCLIYFTDIGQPGMQAYVDRNFNFNYTDDGVPFKCVDSVITVELPSPRNESIPKLSYTLLSNKMDVGNIPAGIFENNLFYSGVTFMDKIFWFAVEPLWIKGKDVVIGNDSLCVTFFDNDVDGCFTGAKDMIALLPYGTDSSYTSKYLGVRTLEPGMILGYNNHAYEIKCDTSKCSPVTLTLRPDLPPPIALSIGDPLPHFSVQFFDGDSADIYTAMQAGKYTYIEFWGMWCGGCRLIIPDLKEMNDTLGNRLTIISLDAYDDRERARSFVKEKQMTWTQGFSNEKVEQLVYAGDGFPYGILVDPNGNIVAFDVHPGEVAEIVAGEK